MEFKRQLYIADLFHPEQIINAFDFVEFNSIEAFKKATKMDYFNIKKGDLVQITIKSFKDFKFMVYLWKIKKELFNEMDVNLIIPTIELLDEIMAKPIPEDFRVSVFSASPYTTSNYWKVNEKWISKHILGMIQTINAETIALDICGIVDYYNTMNLRFFILDIDYISLTKLTVKELEKVEYWFNYLRNWAKEDNKGINPLVIMGQSNFYRKIFVDDDLSLYLNAHKDSVWSFPSLSGYEGATGEIIKADALNNLHQYLDLTAEAIYTKFAIKNWNLIDYNQILKMGHYINEIPLIMGLVQRWLYGQ